MTKPAMMRLPKSELDNQLTRALEETFPASDAITVGEPTSDKPERPLHRRTPIIDAALVMDLANEADERHRREPQDKEIAMPLDAVDQLDKAADTAADVTQQVTDAASQALEKTKETAENFGIAVERLMRDRPAVTLLATLAAGIVVGTLWKMK